MEKINSDYITFMEEKLSNHKWLYQLLQNNNKKKYLTFNEDDRINLIFYIGRIIGFHTTIISGRGLQLQYGILEEFRNKGFGTAVLNKLVAEYFENGYESIMLRIKGDNEASIALAQKCGFKLDDTKEYINFMPDEYYNFYKQNTAIKKMK